MYAVLQHSQASYTNAGPLGPCILQASRTCQHLCYWPCVSSQRWFVQWVLAHAQGDAGTAGQFDEPMYRYGVSMKAQEPNHAGDCFKVL